MLAIGSKTIGPIVLGLIIIVVFGFVTYRVKVIFTGLTLFFTIQGATIMRYSWPSWRADKWPPIRPLTT